MPTYYSCGCLYDSYPSETDVERDEMCPGCRSEDYDRDYDDYGPVSRSPQIERIVTGIRERWDSPHPMLSPNLSRAVSCEWEAAAGVREAEAALLYLGSDGHPFEHHGDCTCDGELVFSRIQLWDAENARRYGNSLAVLAGLRDAGISRMSLAAGHHVHVSSRDTDGRGLSPNAIVSLYSVFAHLEDFLYRIAAAGWTRHRCESDSGYSAPMIKLQHGQRRTPLAVGRTISHDRYQGLNVQPFMSAIQQCRCGAYRFGEWDSCECPDHGHTIEWRLWNGAVSARKIRAYCAISSVLTSYAANVDVREVTDLSENEFQGCGYVNEESLAAQWDYLATRPGFSPQDRKDLSWLVSISPGFGSLAREASPSVSETYV